MVKIYSSPAFTRKMTKMKNDLVADAFYSTPIVARIKVQVGASGIYNRNIKMKYSDTIVSGIAEYGPQFVTFDEVAQTIDGDVRFSCQVADKATIDGADELWLRTSIVSGVIEYSAENLTAEDSDNLVTESGNSIITGNPSDFTEGTMYKVNSQKPSIFSLDEIYILKLGGKVS